MRAPASSAVTVHPVSDPACSATTTVPVHGPVIASAASGESKTTGSQTSPISRPIGPAGCRRHRLPPGRGAHRCADDRRERNRCCGRGL